jgi:lysophospholipase L1-like esterase
MHMKYYLFILLIFCSVLAFGTTPLDEKQLITKFNRSTNPAVFPSPRSEHWLANHNKRDAILQKGDVDILLVGDSITHSWNKHPELSKAFFAGQRVFNLGQPADKTENIVWRLLNHQMVNISPQVAIILAGTNNSNGDEYSAEEIAGGVEAIIQVLQAKLPKTKILLLGIFPRGSYEQRIGIKSGLASAVMNPQWEKINQVNRIIETFADGENVVYLNINQAFLTEDGALPITVMPDMLHLSEKGYEIWGQSMTPVLKKLMQNSE